jgi:hypothetical protein
MDAGGMHCRVPLAGHKTYVYARRGARKGGGTSLRVMCHTSTPFGHFTNFHGLVLCFRSLAVTT